MADQEQLSRLKEGVAQWNQWLRSHYWPPSIDLSGADLRRANLRGAVLNTANLRAANLSGADLRGAQLKKAVLSFANLSGAKLKQANACGGIFDSANFSRANLSGCNLSGANLTNAHLNRVNPSLAVLRKARLHKAFLRGADLCEAILEEAKLDAVKFRSANLYKANLSRASVRDADLSGANLSQVQALETDFSSSVFTNACLHDWHINRSTKLEGSHADYVYLEGRWNSQTKQWDGSERRPMSGVFQVGEFAALFQKALDTLDLIFVDGIDWQAFFASFRELRQQYEAADLNIQAIERKPGQNFVIRLDVSADVDKIAIEQSAKTHYAKQLQLVEAQYHEQLQAQGYELVSYQRENANLMQIMSWMSQRPINVNQTTNPSMNQSQGPQFTNSNQGATIGNFANQLNDNASQNTYSSEQRKTLAEAAQEIQALLDQLSQTYPTETFPQKAQLVEEAIAQVQTNSPLKQRLLSALDAGTIGAIAQALNHPAAAFFIEAVKDWNQNKPKAQK